MGNDREPERLDDDSQRPEPKTRDLIYRRENENEDAGVPDGTDFLFVDPLVEETYVELVRRPMRKAHRYSRTSRRPRA
jgi:hypothetical protein